MELQKSPDKHSCLLTCTAMILDAPVHELAAYIGYGGDILIDGRPKGHCIMDIQHLLLDRGVALVEYAAHSIDVNGIEFYTHEKGIERIELAMRHGRGIFIGKTDKRMHAIAWDGSRYYDVNSGIIDSLEELKYKFEVESFCLLTRITST